MRTALLFGAASLVMASPYPKGSIRDTGFAYLLPRDCSNPCGADGQYCCGDNEACSTMSGDVATCVAGDSYPDYTTTWTETFTSTHYTHWIPAPAPTPGVDCIPQNDEWQPCGEICCAGWQTCAAQGQCSSRPGYQEPSTVLVTNTENGQVTTQYSAPYRVTGTTVLVSAGIRTVSATTTTDSTATATSTSDSDQLGGAAGGGGHHGLSAGAIAGIVIGVLAAVGLLLLLCFCCIARGLWHAIFGRKKDRDDRTTTEITEERYGRHGRTPSAYSRKDEHSGWFSAGGRPSSAGGRREKKHSKGFWLALTAGAATLLALLNFRNKKKAKKPAQSRYSESYYSYGDSPSK